jgi:hypothetical protein
MMFIHSQSTITMPKPLSTGKSEKNSPNVRCYLPSLLLKCLLFATVKENYGSDAEEDDSEDSEEAESEDEDGEELTPAVDAAILRTLARIKRQDPEIYETEKSIFEGMTGLIWYWYAVSSDHRGAKAYGSDKIFSSD